MESEAPPSGLRPVVKALLDEVLDGVDITAPAELADALELDSRIRPRMPAGASLDTYHRYKDLVVTARAGHEVLHRRILEAK
jgi:hypothetical protein